MKSLPNNHNKIKPQTLTLLLQYLVVVLVGVGGFGLGRLSVQSASQAPAGQVGGVYIDTSASEPYFSAQTARETLPKPIMASQHGTRYYPPDCNTGTNIKDENKIWFVDANEAKMAGYTLAKACQ